MNCVAKAYNLIVTSAKRSVIVEVSLNPFKGETIVANKWIMYGIRALPVAESNIHPFHVRLKTVKRKFIDISCL